MNININLIFFQNSVVRKQGTSVVQQQKGKVEEATQQPTTVRLQLPPERLPPPSSTISRPGRNNKLSRTGYVYQHFCMLYRYKINFFLNFKIYLCTTIICHVQTEKKKSVSILLYSFYYEMKATVMIAGPDFMGVHYQGIFYQ